MNTTHDAEEIHASFKRDPRPYSAANLLKNADFSPLMEEWESKNLRVISSDQNTLAVLGASSSEESLLFQAVESLPRGRYLAAFSYYYFTESLPTTVDLLLGEQVIGVFTLERSHYPFPEVFNFCFVVVDLEATPSTTFMLRKPGVNDPISHFVLIDKVWLTPLESLPTHLFLVNGDFEWGSEYWKLHYAVVHPIIGGGGKQHLALGPGHVYEASAEQKLLWIRKAAGSYKLSFTIAPMYAGASEPELGEVSLTGDGIDHHVGFEVGGDGKRTLDFIFDLSEADVGQDITLRIVKLPETETFQSWFVDDVQLEPVPSPA